MIEIYKQSILGMQKQIQRITDHLLFMENFSGKHFADEIKKAKADIARLELIIQDMQSLIHPVVKSRPRQKILVDKIDFVFSTDFSGVRAIA